MQLGRGLLTHPTRLIFNQQKHIPQSLKMHFLLKVKKRRHYLWLLPILLTQGIADAALYILACDPPAQYHIEASFQKDTGFKVVFDKR
jgi:hypothetical protein